MSIDTTKNFIEKSGCGKAFGVVIALVMLVSVFQSCGVGQDAQSGQAAAPANEPSVVTVGKVGAPVSAFESLYERAIQIRETQVRAQAGDNFEGLSQSDRAIVYSEVAGQVVTNLINMHYAQEAGISISKDMALAESTKQFEDQVNTARQQLIQQGKLTATSTQEDLDKAIKELAGKTLTELRAENTATASDLYDSPGGKLILEGGAAVTAYKSQMESKTVVSEDELKKSFQSARLKSIVFKQNPTGPDRTAEAQKVLDEIKAGTITFEAAMDKYSQNPFAPKDKKPSQHEDILAMQFLLVDKDYAPIMDLKPGQMSAVIKGADGPVIYRLIKFEGSVPPDFEATKAEKMKNHKMFVANVAYFKRLEADMMTLPKFVDGGYEILYKTSMLMREAKYANLEEGLRNQARSLTTGSPRPRDVGRFFLERRYYNKLKPEEKKTKFEPYLEAMRGFVSVFDGPTIRMDIVDLLIEMKSPAAGAELIPASLTNSTFGQMGQAFNTRINTALDKAKAAKLITPEEIKQVEENQKRWIEGKREYEKQIAAQAAQRKEAEAALAKEKAAAEAAEKAKGKEPAKPGTSSSDLMAPPAPEKK